MFKISKKFFYIILFGILWLITAFSSFFHAVEFFELSNVTWMGVILALAFEIGQASTLMSILTSKQNQKKYTPWILMCILTLVQIIGNVYSSYKYIMLNSPENLKYFKEPIFIWTQLPDDQATVIVTYVSAAILPIVALLMTAMITNYLSDQEEKKKLESLDIREEVGEEIEDDALPKENQNPLINQNSILQMENEGLQESNKKKDAEINELKNQLASRLDNLHAVENIIKEKDNEIEKIKEELNQVNEEDTTGTTEQQDKSNNEGEQSLETEAINSDYTNTENDKTPSETNKQIDERIPEEQKRESHFINL